MRLSSQLVLVRAHGSQTENGIRIYYIVNSKSYPQLTNEKFYEINALPDPKIEFEKASKVDQSMVLVVIKILWSFIC